MSLFDDQYEFLQAGDVEQFTAHAEELAYNLIEEECDELNLEPSPYRQAYLKEPLKRRWVGQRVSTTGIIEKRR